MISFLAGVAIFHFQITTSFLVGSTIVILSTWLYNQPVPAPASATPRLADSPVMRSASARPSGRETGGNGEYRDSPELPTGLSINLGGASYPAGWDHMRSRQYTGAVPATPDLVVGFERQMSAAPLPPSR